MRPERSQLLSGERENLPEVLADSYAQELDNNVPNESDNSSPLEQNLRPQRTKQLPTWLADYDTKWY